MRLAVVLLLLVGAPLASGQTAMPMTGRDVPALVPYENALKPIMQKWSIPGAALAISDQGRLVYARGFGYADKEAQIPVQPASLFRLASISKTLTGMTIVKLAEEGRLNLDAKFIDLLPAVTPIPTLTFDQRMRGITVRMLLQHTGGWDRDVPNDSSLQFFSAAKALNVPYASLTPDLMARWCISQKLDFDPGTRYSYSQAGYLLLGRIIEKITGKKYEDAVREKLLMPAGVTTLKLGHSLLSQKEPDEVKYYDYPGAPATTTPTVPNAPNPTPRPYGSYWVEQAESYGGWIGNTIDLIKYINTLEGRRGSAILNAASVASIGVRPSATPTGEYVGLTWRITPLSATTAHWWHSGGATGTRNILARRQNNRDWVVLMNSRPQDEDAILSEVFAAFSKAETQVTSWPTNDLFFDFSGSALSTSVQALTFNAVVDAPKPAAQVVQITAAPAPVSFALAPSTAKWLTIDKLTGTTPSTLNVNVDAAGLLPAIYSAVITINAPQSSNASRSLPVTLTVTAVPGFTALRNAASLQPVNSAAPASRLVVDAPDLSTDAVIKVTGADGVELTASIIAATQARADIVVPAEVPLGDANIAITTSAGKLLRDKIQIVALSPGLFAASGDGSGPALANTLTTDTEGNFLATPVFDCSSGTCATVPIDLGIDDSTTILLQLSATGVRGQTDVSAFSVTIGDQLAEVTVVEASATTAGVDLITVKLPRSIAGLGDVAVTLTVDGKTSNAVKLNIL